LSGDDVKRKGETVMKKKLFVMVMLAAVLAFGLMVVGCTTNKGMYDASVPVEQQRYLEIGKGLYISEFDGVRVNWSPSVLAYILNTGKVKISIPAGTHSFEATYNERTRSGAVQRVQQEYEFLPGHTYTLTRAALSFGGISYEGKIKITDKTKK
jgi:hypothetical protein